MQVQVLPCAPLIDKPGRQAVPLAMRRRFSTLRAPLLLGALLLGAFLVGGCANRYVITTTHGAKLVTASKPRLVGSMYVYKDANRQPVEISAMRVRQIEPYSRAAAGSQLLVPELR